MAKLTEGQVKNANRNTRLYAEVIAENVCEAMDEITQIPKDQIEKFYVNLIESIGESVRIELEEYEFTEEQR